jgi:UV DNA damage endonuclease
LVKPLLTSCCHKLTEQITASPQLGLVCITASNAVRYKTITRKRLLQLEPAEQQRSLHSLYTENLRRLNAAVDFCHAQEIRLYRLISNTFPFADEPIGEEILAEFAGELRQVGDRALQLGIRLVLHPDQFVVLNSNRPDVIANSIKILKTHAHIFDLMGLPQSPWALMNIHGGKGDRADRLIQVVKALPDTIRCRLTFENDEHTYGAQDILAICRATGVPMVFDAHHHVIYQQLTTYEDPSVAEMVAAARETWTNPEWQLVHISNGSASFNDPRHSELITLMPSSYRSVPWIEVEAKQKEVAIEKLRHQWLSTETKSPRLITADSDLGLS